MANPNEDTMPVQLLCAVGEYNVEVAFDATMEDVLKAAEAEGFKRPEGNAWIQDAQTWMPVLLTDPVESEGVYCVAIGKCPVVGEKYTLTL